MKTGARAVIYLSPAPAVLRSLWMLIPVLYLAVLAGFGGGEVQLRHADAEAAGRAGPVRALLGAAQGGCLLQRAGKLPCLWTINSPLQSLCYGLGSGIWLGCSWAVLLLHWTALKERAGAGSGQTLHVLTDLRASWSSLCGWRGASRLLRPALVRWSLFLLPWGFALLCSGKFVWGGTDWAGCSHLGLIMWSSLAFLLFLRGPWSLGLVKHLSAYCFPPSLIKKRVSKHRNWRHSLEMSLSAREDWW